MTILKFKSTINCGGCVARVTPFLNKLEGIASWKVDTESQDKILTVESTGASAEEVIATVEKIGFKAESI